MLITWGFFVVILLLLLRAPLQTALNHEGDLDDAIGDLLLGGTSSERVTLGRLIQCLPYADVDVPKSRDADRQRKQQSVIEIARAVILRSNKDLRAILPRWASLDGVGKQIATCCACVVICLGCLFSFFPSQSGLRPFRISSGRFGCLLMQDWGRIPRLFVNFFSS